MSKHSDKLKKKGGINYEEITRLHFSFLQLLAFGFHQLFRFRDEFYGHT